MDLIAELERRYLDERAQAPASAGVITQAEMDRLEREAKDAKDRAEAAETKLGALGDIEERIGRLVAAAQEEADRTTREAETYRAQLHEDAARRVAAAEQRVGQLLDEAQQHAASITDLARQEAARLNEVASKRELAFIDEVEERISRLRDAQLAELRATRTTLAGVATLAAALRTGGEGSVATTAAEMATDPPSPVEYAVGAGTTDGRGPDTAQAGVASPPPGLFRRPSLFRVVPVLGKSDADPAEPPSLGTGDNGAPSASIPVPGPSPSIDPSGNEPMQDIFSSNRQDWSLDDLADLADDSRSAVSGGDVWPQLPPAGEDLHARDLARLTGDEHMSHQPRGWNLRRRLA